MYKDKAKPTWTIVVVNRLSLGMNRNLYKNPDATSSVMKAINYNPTPNSGKEDAGLVIWHTVWTEINRNADRLLMMWNLSD